MAFKIEQLATMHSGLAFIVANKFLFATLLMIFQCSLASCQQSPFSRTIVTENDCTVRQLSYELQFQKHFPDSVLCWLSPDRIYLNSVRSEFEETKYFLLQSVDSISDGVKNNYETIKFTGVHFERLPDISPVLPLFYKNFSKEYIRQLPDSIAANYPYYGFGPIRKIKFNKVGVEISIEAFNGLGYKFVYELRDKTYVCIATFLQNFGNFYTDIKPVPRNLFVGKKMTEFNYSELYEYFEETEDL